MKNIHVLTTDKPSRLAYDFDKLILNSRLLSPILYKTQNIYITSDEEIKKDDYWINVDNNTISNGEMFELANDAPSCKKIILTTDQDLIKDGVQEIDNEFLEWFVKNPTCEEVIVTNLYGDFNPIEYYYETLILKEELHSMDDEVECNNCGNLMSLTEDESIYACYNSECTSCYKPYEEEESKQETLEEFIKEELEDVFFTNISERKKAERLIELGAKWQQERSYSEEEVLEMMRITRRNEDWTVSQLFEQFKK